METVVLTVPYKPLFARLTLPLLTASYKALVHVLSLVSGVRTLVRLKPTTHVVKHARVVRRLSLF